MASITAPCMVDLFRLIALRLSEARRALGALDGAIGDADHGNSMADGFAAVVRATAAAGDVSPAQLLALAGRSFLSAVGATTGPLYAGALLAASRQVEGKSALTDQDVAGLVVAFAEGIAQRGKARPGDKTMLDAWAPAARAVAEAEGQPALARLTRALAAATEGREATRAMVASLGRAARLGPRSLGHVDPGAASAVVIVAAVLEWLGRHLGQPQGAPV